MTPSQKQTQRLLLDACAQKAGYPGGSFAGWPPVVAQAAGLDTGRDGNPTRRGRHGRRLLWAAWCGRHELEPAVVARLQVWLAS